MKVLKMLLVLLIIQLVVGLSLSFTISTVSSYTLAGTSEQQRSEVIAHKSPLVWRTDGEGDYLLSELSANAVHELVNAIEIPGQIEALTATWQFSGQAALEVSANNGQDYTPVVYGVPLTSGFVSGNHLKWKVTLGAESELTEIKIVYTDTQNAMGTFGEPALSGFNFRTPLFITNTNSGDEDLFNYQMRIRVGEAAQGSEEADVYCQGNIEADFKDVRLTCADGETLLPHYLEGIEGASPNRVATFWVKVPQIPKRGLALFIYYGNSLAEDISSGDAVFDFFDDFSGELDSTKWQSQTNFGGDCGVSDGFLKLDAAEIISQDYQIKDGIIEYRARPEAGYEIRAIIRQKEEKPDLTQLAYSSSYAGAEHCIAVGNIVKTNALEPILPQVLYDFRIIARGANLTFERYSMLDAGYSMLDASVTYEDTGGLPRGQIGLKTGGGGNGDSVAYYDWLRVRKYAEIEPRVRQR